MPGRLRIAVVDDHPLYREGVVQTLRRSEEFEVVAEGGSAIEATEIATLKRPDVILLDISMPGGGLAAVHAITTSFPEIKILMLTVSENQDDVLTTLEVGACGYLLKGIGSSELINMITSVHRGEIVVSPNLAARLLTQMKRKYSTQAPERTSSLTFREDEILELVGRGLTNKEIARTLQMSEKTVKHYMTSIMQKLHVRNRVEAAISLWRTDDPRPESRTAAE